LLEDVYRGVRTEARRADLRYSAGKSDEGGSGFFVEREGRFRATAGDGDEFLALLSDDITIELQKLRPDLYFVHSAVVETKGRAVLLAAEAGGGKSTTTWALLHHGFRFLSDELAPVDLESVEVQPFPRAICLKSSPPEPYALPGPVPSEARIVHVPVDELPTEVVYSPVPVRAVVFVRHDSGGVEPSLNRLDKSRAATLLYAHALNPLAHHGDGLDGALRIAEHAACFELIANDLPRTTALIRSTISELAVD